MRKDHIRQAFLAPVPIGDAILLGFRVGHIDRTFKLIVVARFGGHDRGVNRHLPDSPWTDTPEQLTVSFTRVRTAIRMRSRNDRN